MARWSGNRQVTWPNSAGAQRSVGIGLCIEMRSWRGSPEQPGLMMGLRRGGSCVGIAQHLLGSDRHEVRFKLLKHEIGGPIGYAALQLIDLHTDDGPLQALCFYADPPEASGKPEAGAPIISTLLAGTAGRGAC